jgi:hypothetical protein
MNCAWRPEEMTDTSISPPKKIPTSNIPNRAVTVYTSEIDVEGVTRNSMK